MSTRRCPHALVVATLAFAALPAMAAAPPPFAQLPWPNAHGATALARYGAVVAPAGDVNGDGFSDLIEFVQDAGGDVNVALQRPLYDRFEPVYTAHAYFAPGDITRN